MLGTALMQSAAEDAVQNESTVQVLLMQKASRRAHASITNGAAV